MDYRVASVVNRYEPIREKAIQAFGIDARMMRYLEGRGWQVWALPWDGIGNPALREFELRKIGNGGYLSVRVDDHDQLYGDGLLTLVHNIADGEGFFATHKYDAFEDDFGPRSIDTKPIVDAINNVIEELTGPMGRSMPCSEGYVTGDVQARVEKVEGSKATNPKDAIGSKKVPLFSVIPWPVIKEIALGLLEGALKYGRHNYRVYGVRASVYMDATLRHLGAWWEGQDIDPDSRLSHITKAIASLTVLRDAMLQEMWTDDRPPRSDDAWVSDANDFAKRMIEEFKGEPVPSYTEKDKK